MANASDPQRVGGSGARVPLGRVLGATALAGVAAGGCSVALALTSDHLAEPGLQVSLVNWVTLSYVFAGLIAWGRRPASRLGPLMVVAGFTVFVSSFQWANLAFPYTLGSWL